VSLNVVHVIPRGYCKSDVK